MNDPLKIGKVSMIMGRRGKLEFEGKNCEISCQEIEIVGQDVKLYRHGYEVRIQTMDVS